MKYINLVGKPSQTTYYKIKPVEWRGSISLSKMRILLCILINVI